MVEVSMTVLPVPSAGSMTSITSTTSGELGTHRMITSEASATPKGEPPSTAPWETAASMGPRPREATVTSWPAATRGPAMGRPMAPSPLNPMRMRGPPDVPVSVRRTGAATPPCRRGARRPWRRSRAGPPGPPTGRARRPRSPACAHAVPVNDADRLDRRVRRQAGGLTGVRDVHRGREGLPREHGLDHGRRQLARLPGLQVLGAGQPGVDVGDVVRLVLLAPGNRTERNVVGRTPLGLGREGERHEFGNVAVSG